MTRNIPNERRKGGAERSAVGHVEIDIVHLLKDEFYEDELGQLADSLPDEIGAKDGYILTLVIPGGAGFAGGGFATPCGGCGVPAL